MWISWHLEGGHKELTGLHTVGTSDASDHLSQQLTDTPSLLLFKNVHSRVLGRGFKGLWVPHLPRLLAFRWKTLFFPYHSWVRNWFCEQWVVGPDLFDSRYCHRDSNCFETPWYTEIKWRSWYKWGFYKKYFLNLETVVTCGSSYMLFNLSALTFLIHNVWILITVYDFILKTDYKGFCKVHGAKEMPNAREKFPFLLSFPSQLIPYNLSHKLSNKQLRIFNNIKTQEKY